MTNTPSYKQPLTPLKPSRPDKPSIYKPEVWSSSDSLDIDDVLATPLELSDSSLIKTPLPVAQKPEARSTRGVTTRRNKCQQIPPNTVAVTRRNIPGEKGPLTNRFSNPVPSKRSIRSRRSKTPPISWMSPARPKVDTIAEQGPTSLPLSMNSVLSPERRTKSYDGDLDKLKISFDSEMEPLTPTKQKNGIFGSFEKGLDQVRLLLTPSKKRNKDQEPRKIKAVSNVSRISRKDPKSVLKNLHQVVSCRLSALGTRSDACLTRVFV